ncbi:helix-turn-helix transcriptional regulator [Pseudomonas gingeri]|uniref:helix-turn-helix transcriptional regulator n=1 Tax=Pseudomonas gingeri TaxID=117681 RepID=UPI0015A1AC56|nr:helix-turn-helix domain-containing protein [Pseudomonas gingeri]NVZ99635.1 helix-turn-helix domain-containing protein [Pseudomonas gingeri]NWA16475.1 helix-turn-helix domain-containing protein [Pseudomonas gingeri]NWA54139.1 helix-turn-helix domain-containing protein [Pseudomonas gingeri]NWA98645.1 helix-turn-helix domain-containing protein [Pseudomonas gingeri]NWB05736.1 helix-turn-helix domain-containing protein [Pseudomonas gingeri]
MNDLLVQDQFAQQLRALRKRRGLTQAQVAALAMIDRKQVILVEKGLGSVSFEFYSKVIAALGCSIEIKPATRPTLEELQGIFNE